ncbi:hypothetical protein llap_17243 [Limosa lapponica baueri]|uniref:Uncharacterized protein n=1 Tax=Limosa lapponica baueri TaxID=1758121 RepID=A0A2I0TF73_LIMLA|nr:hypothetical protein llap_17243 [Limosa lapponica baueri]
MKMIGGLEPLCCEDRLREPKASILQLHTFTRTTVKNPNGTARTSEVNHILRRSESRRFGLGPHSDEPSSGTRDLKEVAPEEQCLTLLMNNVSATNLTGKVFSDLELRLGLRLGNRSERLTLAALPPPSSWPAQTAGDRDASGRPAVKSGGWGV